MTTGALAWSDIYLVSPSPVRKSDCRTTAAPSTLPKATDTSGFPEAPSRQPGVWCASRCPGPYTRPPGATPRSTTFLTTASPAVTPPGSYAVVTATGTSPASRPWPGGTDRSSTSANTSEPSCPAASTPSRPPLREESSRSDLDAYLRVAEESGALRVLDIGGGGQVCSYSCRLIAGPRSPYAGTASGSGPSARRSSGFRPTGTQVTRGGWRLADAWLNDQPPSSRSTRPGAAGGGDVRHRRSARADG